VGVAQDQYASTFAFSVRKEETQSSLDIIGGITQLAGSATSDTDILYEFIRSQDLVARVNAELDLRSIWSRAWPDDPVFGFDPSGTIEDLHAHWLRKLDIAYDAGTGIVTLRVLAFDPVDARNIATAISGESTRVINALSEEARADATGQAREERDLAFARLRDARQAVTAFRLRTQIVDIESDLQGQMGLLNTLQAQLANTLIELDLQRETAPQGDPRVRQAERRIEVIEARIAAERAKFGEGGQGPGGEDYARIAAEFERLTVEREFAESTYRSALAAYEGALSSAQRQSRYLAVHIRPTLAERALYPQRVILCALVGFFCWCSGA
jgi:capsular polysaccharide transport system permease protein